MNSWHQHFNGQSDKPVRYIGVTRAPVYMNLFHDLDFIFKHDHIFKNRYYGEEGYFNSQGKAHPNRIWESNFIPDCREFKLQEWQERGAGGSTIFFELSNNIQSAHISEFPVGTYKKGHRAVLLQSLLFNGLAFFPQALVTSAYQLLPLRAIMGFSAAGIEPSTQSMIVKNTNDSQRGGVLGIAHSVRLSGQAIGPFVGGSLAAVFGYRVPFVLTAILLIFISFFFRYYAKNTDQ